MISRVLIGALALLLAANFIPGIEVMGLYTAIIAALILGLLNTIVRPVLIVLTLPVTIRVRRPSGRHLVHSRGRLRLVGPGWHQRRLLVRGPDGLH